jgi:hypothetical protein
MIFKHGLMSGMINGLKTKRSGNVFVRELKMRSIEYKLTAISLRYYRYGREIKKTIFARLPIIDGKAIASQELINEALGGLQRGETFSSG